MALVKPMIQSGSKSYEDEIFIGDGVYKKEAGNKSSFHSDDNQQIIIKPLVKQESIKIISNLGADAKNKLCSKETIMRRKRNSLSMLGKSPGEDQLQKISNSIQGRVSFSKRAKCFPK
ncbi:uncharacterized protein LOC124435672 [Xenia sp. Carnegie-2017]|uniref:uncharacterized protein LOC124435672 n=1 Tax=Xenia sp. Carnegie-2017 TaxID=2897299 RepID=UPI001F038BA1|nr:uncharacterized protein LOC124435672 [Xenia sp. Carnegie-2017]